MSLSRGATDQEEISHQLAVDDHDHDQDGDFEYGPIQLVVSTMKRLRRHVG